MSIKYGDLYVDERYKSALLPNLFYKTFLVPGVTYQDVASDNNGRWFWHKLVSSGAVEPGVPGRDFDDEAMEDTLVNCDYNNNFQSSKKIYGVQAAAVSYQLAEEALALATNEVAEGKNFSALACLITEGTDSANTSAITAETFKADVLAVRQELVENKGRADVVLCSPALFAMMLEFAGSQYLPSSNEMLIAAAGGGQVGEWLGMTWIEVNGFATTADAVYYDYTGTKVTVDDGDINDVAFIMYDHNAFGVGDNFNIARIIDSELFAGSKAQIEDNVAFRVLNSDLVIVRGLGE